MPKEGQTGLVIPVPAADPLLASVAAHHPGTVREGIPAHVSVLYPFIAAADLDEGVADELSNLFAEQPLMPVTFAECRRREGFVYLRPDPIDGLEELTRKVRQRWSEVEHYERAHRDIEPHLTIAMYAEETAGAIEQEVTAALPISAQMHEAWLVALEERWVLRGRFTFGTAH